MWDMRELWWVCVWGVAGSRMGPFSINFQFLFIITMRFELDAHGLALAEFQRSSRSARQTRQTVRARGVVDVVVVVVVVVVVIVLSRGCRWFLWM